MNRPFRSLAQAVDDALIHLGCCHTCEEHRDAVKQRCRERLFDLQRLIGETLAELGYEEEGGVS
jgi:hypothetical protein